MRSKTRLRHRRALLCLMVLSVLLGRASLAAEKQVKGADPCLRDKECKALYEKARKLSKVGQLEAALVQYQTAFAAQPVPWLLVNIGRTQQKLGRPQQAIVSYKRFLEADGGEDAELREKATTYIAEAEKSISEQSSQRPSESRSDKDSSAAPPASPPVSLLTPPDPGAAPEGTKLDATAQKDAPKPVYKKWSYKKFFRSDGAGCWNREAKFMTATEKIPPCHPAGLALRLSVPNSQQPEHLPQPLA